MSIIHDALKKAAAEKEEPLPHLSSLEYHSKKSTGFAWVNGVALFLLLGLFLSAGFYFYRQEESALMLNPVIVPSKTMPEREVLTPKESSQIKDTSPENISDRQKKEGEKALLEGLEWYRRGEYNRASRLFREAIAAPSQAVMAHNNLGLALRHQGKVNEAITHYKEALRLDPNYAEAHNNLGMAHDFTGSIDQAGDHYKKAVDLKPSVPTFHLNYATWLERKGAFGSARREYQSFLRLSSKQIEAGNGSEQQIETVALVKSRLKQLKGSLP